MNWKNNIFFIEKVVVIFLLLVIVMVIGVVIVVVELEIVNFYCYLDWVFGEEIVVMFED